MGGGWQFTNKVIMWGGKNSDVKPGRRGGVIFVKKSYLYLSILDKSCTVSLLPMDLGQLFVQEDRFESLKICSKQNYIPQKLRLCSKSSDD